MAISNSGVGIRPGVCTSTTRPTAPYEGQMIYETDTDLVYLYNGSAWIEVVSALTKAPRGVVAYAKKTTATNLTTANTQLLVAPAFTAASGRVYKVTAQAYFQSVSNALGSTSYYNFSIYNGGSQIQVGDYSAHTNAPYTAQTLSTYITGASGSVTISIYAGMGLGTGQVYANSTNLPLVLLVEDIGAV